MPSRLAKTSRTPVQVLVVCLILGLTLAFSRAASAQTATGNIHGVTRDESGAVVPGVSVALTSGYGSRATTTGPDGGFRFLGLVRGDYTLTLSLAGFASTSRSVRVTTGENLDLSFAMKVSTFDETLDVLSETPLVDSKRRGTATTLTSEELARVPNPRDPWGVLKAVPGVMVDRVNIAGNENGQQAASSSKGQPPGENTWNLDGVVITDMSAAGSSSSYFDFGAFEEINVTTGGTELAMPTGGAGINLTTKRGTNLFRGGARFLITDESLSLGNIDDQTQAPFVPEGLASDPRLRNADGSYRDQGDRIRSVKDYGFDLGGPILKDRLWFYASYGKQEIRLLRMDETPDENLLPSWNAKLNWQATANTMLSAFHFRGAKQKFGRAAGSGLLEAESFLVDQDYLYAPGGLPGGIWKVQVDHTASPSLFLSLKAMYFDNGFTLKARGDPAQAGTRDFVTRTAVGTSTTYAALRPHKNVTGDGSYYFPGAGGSHELKFGFSYRDLRTSSGTTWHGNQLYGYINGATNRVARAFRSYEFSYAGRYFDLYLGDMFTRDRLTVNLGLRFDAQSARNLESRAIANATFPELLPDAVFEGSDGSVQDWKTLSPRVGLSWAFDASRRTVLRASYARYYQQLPMSDVTVENPTSGSFLAYGWVDANGDRFVQPGEVALNDLRYWSGVDPANPGSVARDTVSKVDRDRRPRSDDELVIGLDRELAPSFAAGVAWTYRRADDWPASYRFAGACTDPLEPTAASCPLIGESSYTRNRPVSAKGYTAFTYSPDPALVAAGRGGSLLTNRQGYSTSYNGLELTLNKRLSGRWMTRVAFTYADWRQSVERAVGTNGNPTRRQNDNLVDGDQVTLVSGGSGKGPVFFTGIRWQVYANALYQLPWGIDIAGSVWGRQGAPKPVFLNLAAGNDGTLAVVATASIADERYDDVWHVDLRLARTFRFGRRAYLTLAGEWFNVANAGTVLIRVRQANSTAYNRIDELLQPSILRLGATVGF